MDLLVYLATLKISQTGQDYYDRALRNLDVDVGFCGSLLSNERDRVYVPSHAKVFGPKA